MNYRHVILGLYLVLFVGLGVAGGYLFLDARHEYNRLVQVEDANRQRLAEVQERLKNQVVELNRLRNDPAYVDSVIRKKLGYAKPDEFIFHFQD